MIDPIHWTCTACEKRNWISLPKPVGLREEHAGVCRFCQHVDVLIIGANWGNGREISRSVIRRVVEDLFG